MPAVAAVLIFAMGLLNTLSALVPGVANHVRAVERVFPLDLREGSRTLTVLLGIALIFLARGLWRSKRHAWYITVVLLAASVPLHIIRGFQISEASLALTLIAMLFIFRTDFQARSDPPSALRGYLMLLATCAAVVLYALSGLIVLGNQLAPRASFVALVSDLVAWATTSSPIFHPVTERAAWFLNSIPWIAACTLAYGMWMVLRPVVGPRLQANEDRRLVRGIVAAYGDNPMATYLTDGDKSFFFSDDGRSVIGYRVAGNVAVICGDPVAPREALPGFLAEFLDYARVQDWQVVLYEVLPQNMALYRQLGFQALKIGEDAVVNARTFTLVGKRIANVRHAVTHAERAGIRPHFFFGQVTDEAINRQLAAISSAWVACKRIPEMGFSLGRYQEHMPRRNLHRRGRGRIRHGAWLPHLAPPRGPRPLDALDLMRRVCDAPGGVMELLIARSVERFRDDGAGEVSLSLSPLANTQASGRVSLLQNPMERVFQSFSSNLYKYKSLFEFKAKFAPEFQNRYIAYQSTRALPMVLYALIRVHLVAEPKKTRQPRRVPGHTAKQPTLGSAR